jgi:hypothetical protein
MWDTLCVVITVACFSAAVLYVHSCARLFKGERNRG